MLIDVGNRYIALQEEYIKDEQRYSTLSAKEVTVEANFDHRSLKRELMRAQEEIKRIQSLPLVIGQFMEAIDQKLVYSSLLQNAVLIPGFAPI